MGSAVALATTALVWGRLYACHRFELETGGH
jgi:hypothetical protein